MKKIIQITLITFALAIAGAVDAKVMKQRVEKRKVPTAASHVIETAQSALKGQASGQEIINTIQEEAQTAAQEETAPLLAQEKILEEKEKLIKQEIKDINYGFFGIGTTQKQQEEYKDAGARLKQTQSDLTKVRAEINVNKKEAGMSWFNANKYALIAAGVVGVSAAVIYDMYYGKGYTQALIQKGKEAYEKLPNVPYFGAEARKEKAAAAERASLEWDRTHKYQQQQMREGSIDYILDDQLARQRELEDAAWLQRQANKAAAQEKLEATKIRQRRSAAAEAKRLSSR
jgi:hypothetical protein